MIANDILRRLRYILDLSDAQMTEVFALADCPVTREQVNGWLRKDDDPAFHTCSHKVLATFLNGLINDRRGKRDGPQPEPETTLNNNQILVKLKIAYNLKAEEIQEIMTLAGFPVGKHELSAFFRSPGHRQYRQCKDQILRNFLKGLQLKYRDGAK